MPPQLTLGVPYFNRPDLLQRCLHSVLSQDHTDWQLVVCDDSVDQSARAVVEALADSRLRYHANATNLGMAANWNQCLAQAETPYVSLLHADDELLPNYCRVMPRLLDAEPEATAAFCGAEIINEQSRRCFSFPDWVKRFLQPQGEVRLHGEAGLRAILRGNFIMCPTVCYRRTALPQSGFDPQWRFVLDLDLFTRILLTGGTLIGTVERAYAYRRHAGNATSTYTRSLLRFREEAAIYDRLATQAADQGWNSAARTARRKLMIRLHLAYHALADLLSLRWRSLPEQWKLFHSLGTATSGAWPDVHADRDSRVQ